MFAELSTNFLQNLVFFFAAIDPIGTIPIFIVATQHMAKRERMQVAWRSILIATAILVFFVVAGELVLTSIEIPLAAFQVAGGLILFLFSLTMIFGDSKPETELKSLKEHYRTAVFPLAVPSIASPAAMLSAVMLTENGRFNLAEQVMTTLSMLVILLVTLVLMLLSSYFYRFIGENGSAVISRVMGMLLASLAVTHVLQGISDYFLAG